MSVFNQGEIADFIRSQTRPRPRQSRCLARKCPRSPANILHISCRVIGRTVEETLKLMEGYGELLSRPAWDWRWFVTLTYKEAVTEDAIERDWNRFVAQLNRDLFGARWRRRGKTITWAMAIEYQKRGVAHLHALMGLTGHLNQFDAKETWERCGPRIETKDGKWRPRTGYARIYEYKPALGGLNYIIKYVGKGGVITVGCSRKTAFDLRLRPTAEEGLPQDFFLNTRRYSLQATSPF